MMDQILYRFFTGLELCPGFSHTPGHEEDSHAGRQLCRAFRQMVALPEHLGIERLENLQGYALISKDHGILKGIKILQVADGQRRHPQARAAMQAAWTANQPAHVGSDGLVGLATCLASPLSWTHHYVWAAILLIAVTMRSTLPRWAVWLGRAWAVWIALCLPLAVLPYGGHRELDYTAGQKLVGNMGPTLGTILVLALGIHAVVSMRKERAARVAAATTVPG